MSETSSEKQPDKMAEKIVGKSPAIVPPAALAPSALPRSDIAAGSGSQMGARQGKPVGLAPFSATPPSATQQIQIPPMRTEPMDRPPAVVAAASEMASGAAASASEAAGATVARAENVIKNELERTMTTTEDFMQFGRGNMEAFVKAGQIWASGFQDLSRHVAESARAHVEQSMSTFKALTSVKSLQEAIELQSTLARSSMEKAVADGGKITDASMKLAEQAIAPINARLSLAAERFGRTA